MSEIKITVKPDRLKKLKKAVSFNILSFFDAKQIITILITFGLTFFLSIATSQSLASVAQKNSAAAASASAAGAQTDSQPSAISIVTNQPLTLNMDPTVHVKPGEVYLPLENAILPDPLQERREFLKQYLTLKHSVLADHVDALSDQTQWKLIIAISQAESQACKKMPASTHNCWGIGGAWNLKHYANYDQAIADVNRILEQHYISAGLDSPSKIVNKWVGYPSPDWEAAVNQVLDSLKNVQ